MYCIMYRRRYAVRQRQEESIQPTSTVVPSGPVYEELTPIQEQIELKLNEAYGPL